MTIREFFAGVAVADIQASRAWYEQLLGRPPDVVPNANEAAWQVGETGWINIIGDARRSGTALLTLIVDDLERTVAELAARGLSVGAIESAPDAFRKAVLLDPDGTTIALVELLSASEE